MADQMSLGPVGNVFYFVERFDAAVRWYADRLGREPVATGGALAEIYDLSAAGAYTATTPHLTNLSARVQVGTGGNILIAGFVIGGAGLVVAVGLGSFFGATAISKKNQSNSNGSCDVSDSCNATGLGLRSDGLSAANGATATTSR